MAIQWIKNSFDILLPYDGDFPLCSTFDPIREGQKWWELQKSQMDWCDHWIILGGGGGFHLEYLQSRKLFGIVEFRWDHIPNHLMQVRLAHNAEQVMNWRHDIESYPHLRWGIFEFLPAWQNHSPDFKLARNTLYGQAPQSRFYNQLSQELFT
jgi:hypothetical protein